MKINHIALYANNLELIKSFYEKYFDAQSNEKYQNPKTGLETYFLTFQDGSRLEIMTRPDIELVEKKLKNVGYIHLAFSVGSRQNVDNITNLLKQSGYKVISEPRTTGDGYYESCILDPEGNQIEIVE